MVQLAPDDGNQMSNSVDEPEEKRRRVEVTSEAEQYEYEPIPHYVNQ